MSLSDLIELRPIYGYHPDDKEIQEQHIRFIIQRILFLKKININTCYRVNQWHNVFNFKHHQIALEEYPDYPRALQMVLEDTRQEDIPEFYLEVDEELPKYVDTSADIEPHEPKQIIKYVEDTNIAYFRPLEKEWEIKETEQQVLELLEREIQR